MFSGRCYQEGIGPPAGLADPNGEGRTVAVKSGSFDLEFVRRMMAAIEGAMHELGRSPGLELPVMDEITKNFRHQSKDDQQLVFLKGVRYVSMLNAYLVLFAHGFMQEMGVLSRCMDETLQDAMFFVLRTGEDGQLSDRQAMAMHEFYQEEFEDLSSATAATGSRCAADRDRRRAAARRSKLPSRRPTASAANGPSKANSASVRSVRSAWPGAHTRCGRNRFTWRRLLASHTRHTCVSRHSDCADGGDEAAAPRHSRSAFADPRNDGSAPSPPGTGST